MPLRNSVFAYGAVAKLLHWVIGLSIIGLLAIGLWMEELPPGPDKWQVYGWHKATGICVLALVLIRIVWRQWSIIPAMPADFGSLERFAAKSTHALLYLLMVAMPLAGWGMSSAGGHEVSMFGYYTLPPLVEKSKVWSSIFHEMHEIGGYALIGLIGLHVLAAFYHHFIRKDTILKRMLPW